jgi:hypothetical protein
LPRELHHYDLHVWLFKPNPRFAPTNRNVKCPPSRSRTTSTVFAPPGPNELFDASFVPDRSTVEGFLAQGRRTLAEN